MASGESDTKGDGRGMGEGKGDRPQKKAAQVHIHKRHRSLCWLCWRSQRVSIDKGCQFERMAWPEPHTVSSASRRHRSHHQSETIVKKVRREDKVQSGPTTHH
jgi:hypothetical protein